MRGALRSSQLPPSRHASFSRPRADSRQLHVAVLDRDGHFVGRLSGAIESVGWTVQQLERPPEPAALQRMRASVLIVDLGVAGTDGAWLAEQVATTPELAIVACTESSDVSQRVRSLQTGLDGWVAKTCHPLELLARVQAIVRARRGHDALVRPAIHAGELEISPSRYDAIAADRSAGLTTREFEVLELLARHRDVTLARDRIYAGVWGDAVPAGYRSVDIFVGRIRFKLRRISPDWLYIHTRTGVGYSFAAERASGVRAPTAAHAPERADERSLPVAGAGAVTFTPA